MARQITCTNKKNNHSMTFTEDGFHPFLLASVSGIYDSNNEVEMQDNTIIDGATYQGTTIQRRNIVLSLLADPQTDDTFIYNQADRDDLRTLFQKGVEGELVYTENGVSRKINYYTESITRAPRGSRLFTISLLCDHPKFTDMEEQSHSMGSYAGLFEFDHEFPEGGEELEIRMDASSVNIINDTSADNIGLTIIIEALGEVTNPELYHLEQNKFIIVGDAYHTLTLGIGDILTITTGIGNKHIRLTHNGTTTEVNSYLTDDSDFFQLQNGENHISYGASTGRDNMSVTVRYAAEYEGA